MPSYRLYCLDGTGRITGAAQLIDAADDQAAIAAVRDVRHRSRREIWLGRRLVAAIPALPPES